MAEALRVRPLPGATDLEAACRYLAPRRALIVLDNCEHLLDACAEVATALLRAAPAVVVAATSRAPLGVDGETDWRVPPLSLPGEGEGADAVALFVERARSARPGFTLTAEDGPAVDALCVRLDGLPLAIELAAARLRMLTVDQLLERLSDRFGLLTQGSRSASELRFGDRRSERYASRHVAMRPSPSLRRSATPHLRKRVMPTDGAGRLRRHDSTNGRCAMDQVHDILARCEWSWCPSRRYLRSG